jgi:hypothetical protein
MRATGIIGVILIVLGALGLVYQGFSYTSKEEILDIGPIEASVESEERVGIPLWVSGLVLAVGVVLVVSDRRK